MPDARLGKDAFFTLAKAVDQNTDTLEVAESTVGMSATTGFFVRNSNTLHVGDELITYSGVTSEPPFLFTGCERGVLGTEASSHAEGVGVAHLKECFGLFTPDPDSSLFEEVAAAAADIYNECGFDMTYMDALDGEDILGGREHAWHYGSRYVYEFSKRITRPALFEASTFHHHLWHVRSRANAWDHPSRGHRRFIDIHSTSNQDAHRMFLPAHLGWWSIKTWNGLNGEPTFVEDIEYLCSKALGTDTGFSMAGISPENMDRPVNARLSRIIRKYETVRHRGRVSAGVKRLLAEPGAAFQMVSADPERPRLRPADYAVHKVTALSDGSSSRAVENRFAEQPLHVRIEALLGAEPYRSPRSAVVGDPSATDEFSHVEAADGIELSMGREGSHSTDGWPVAHITAANHRDDTDERAAIDGSWAMAAQTFSPPLDISERPALGVWVYGDGKGEVLNFQLTCPAHVVAGVGDHYVDVDFTGWRYFELLELEAERADRWQWPYSANVYAVYRENTDCERVERLSVWYNGIPRGEQVQCLLSPIRALPTVETALVEPTISVGGETLVFPVELETGGYLEYDGERAVVYDGEGKPTGEVTPAGDSPLMRHGPNATRFSCGVRDNVNPRARVTVMTYGEPFDAWR